MVIPMRLKPVLAGSVILFGPLLSLFLLLVFFPGFVVRQLEEYTRLRFDSGIGAGEGALPIGRGELGLYGQRFVIDMVAKTWNAMGPALLWAAIAVALIPITRSLLRKYNPSGRNRLAEPAIFLILLTIMTLWREAPWPMLLVCAGLMLYAMNFLIPFSDLEPRNGGRRLLSSVFFMAGSLTGVMQLLAPVPLLSWLVKLSRLSLRQDELNKVAIRAGRLAVCLISFPLLALFVYSNQETPRPPQVRSLLVTPNLYDIELDYPAGRLIVTRKTGGTGFMLSLDRLEVLREFSLPSAELEDIALDQEAREIYHIDRFNQTIFVWDANSLKVLRKGQISRPSSGSTKLALDERSGRLLVSFENDNLFAVDGHTLACSFMGAPGNVSLVADQQNPLIYVGSERQLWVAAVNMQSCREINRVTGPHRGERMVVSAKRNELYAPDAKAGTIWVFATPSLNLLRKIPAQFGVRTLATDDVNGLLLAASVVTGYVEVLDPASGRCLNRYYVGKYCRVMKTDPLKRRAFITLTRDGLYVINY
ncbi:MAG: hypothetical protein AB1724_10330 [Thermodesulfobacteriota bacterium]